MGSGSNVSGLEAQVKQWQQNVAIRKEALAKARTASEKSAARYNLNSAKEMLQRKREELRRAKAAAKKR